MDKFQKIGLLYIPVVIFFLIVAFLPTGIVPYSGVSFSSGVVYYLLGGYEGAVLFVLLAILSYRKKGTISVVLGAIGCVGVGLSVIFLSLGYAYWLPAIGFYLMLVSLICFCVLTVALYSVRPKKLEKIKVQKTVISKQRVDKLKKIVQVSTRMNINEMTEILGMKKSELWDLLLDWASEFGFTIDGDYLIVNKDTVSYFIEALDKQFADWDKSTDKM